MKRLLVVDDDDEIRDLVQRILTSPHWQVATANDAIEALIKARDIRPFLIVTDVQMPQFGLGTDMVHAIRMDKALKDTPVIVLTSMELGRVKTQLPQGDPKVRMLNKPPAPESLFAMIKELTGIDGKSPPPAGT